MAVLTPAINIHDEDANLLLQGESFQRCSLKARVKSGAPRVPGNKMRLRVLLALLTVPFILFFFICFMLPCSEVVHVKMVQVKSQQVNATRYVQQVESYRFGAPGADKNTATPGSDRVERPEPLQRWRSRNKQWPISDTAPH